jgi:hypothetical protein
MKQADNEKALKDQLTPNFLKKLTRVARLYGWRSDYVEIAEFVDTLHEIADIKTPPLDPYKIDDNIEIS